MHGLQLQRVVGGLAIDSSDFQQGGTMNMYQSFSRMTAGFLLAALLLLVACGGGGGGGGGGGPAPVVYGGSMSQAGVTPLNASKLTANVIGSGDTATTIAGVSVESGGATQNRGNGLTNLARRLSRDFRDTVVRAEQASSTQQVVPAMLVPVNETEPCDGNVGSVTNTGTIDDMTGTGTLAVTFNNCLIDGVTLNGPATLRVDAFDLGFFVPTDFTISFVRLTLRGSGLSIDAGGSMRAEFFIFSQTERITANLVSLNNNTGQMTKTENLVIVNVTTSPTSFTETINGRVFDQVHGFVEITTPTLLVFDTLTQVFPNGGQLLLTGTGNSSIRVTAGPTLLPPLSATMVMLELDLDGDGSINNTAILKWTDLTGPVGADLGDTDLDGMHNSWETFHGLPLDPMVIDAALDANMNGISNFDEYLAGTDPTP